MIVSVKWKKTDINYDKFPVKNNNIFNKVLFMYEWSHQIIYEQLTAD